MYLPILIFAFNEEERSVPVTDEDVERGHLEHGWILTEKSATPYLDRDRDDATLRPLRSMGEEYELHRTADGWAVRWLRGHESRATKARVSLFADEIVGVSMRRRDLQPGMVFTDGGGYCVCLSHVYLSDGEVYTNARTLGTDAAWTMQSSWWPPDAQVTVCCARPSMSFILK